MSSNSRTFRASRVPAAWGAALVMCLALSPAADAADGAAPVTTEAAASISASATNPFDGAALYSLNCANCHGTYGEGDGAVTPSLSVVLLDLRYLSARNEGVFPSAFVRSIIDGREVRAAHGPDGMPVWGAEFARYEGVDEDAEARVAAKIDALTLFLESIQQSN